MADAEQFRSDSGQKLTRIPPVHDEESPGSPEEFLSVRIFRGFMRAEGFKIQLNGAIFDCRAPARAHDESEIAAYLRRRRLDRRELCDLFLLSAERVGLQFVGAEARRALNYIVRTERARLRAELEERVVSHRPRDLTTERREWDKVAKLWKEPADVSEAFMKHGIWQIKRKLLGHRPDFHLMLVIYSENQATGKTTFIKAFLESVLGELVPPPAYISELIDPRTKQLFEFVALIFDDIHKISATDVPKLKQVMTNEKLSRRRLHTHDVNMFDQSATLFATSNLPIEHIIPDDTGHRRFFTLTLRNNAEAEGGSAAIWDIVNSIDFETLWNSVSAWDPCPIKNYTHLLLSKNSPESILRHWLIHLDRESDAYLAIKTSRGAKAREFYALFCTQSGSKMSEKAFGLLMNHLTLNPDVPFVKDTHRHYVFYSEKPEHEGAGRRR